MCILFVHTNTKAEDGPYRLILASNRDEYYIRNARHVEKWFDNPCIISGVDLEPGREGGTWLGLSINQLKESSCSAAVRVGALLNLTGEERHSGALGRGFIVTDFLKNTHMSVQAYLKSLQSESCPRNAFNFVAVELGFDNNKANVYHYSNIGNKITEYQAGIFAFGNSLPERPLSKVNAGQARFQDIINQYGKKTEDREYLVNELLQLLRWEDRHLPDPELQRRAPDSYDFLSSIFVRIPEAGYGTRTHTIILVDWLGEVQYVEHTMDVPINPLQPLWSEKHLTAHL